jgi:acetoin utilization deacetylase AcuC-like enzyme
MYKVAWNEHYCHPLPENHRFPMEKYNLLPQQLLYEGTIQSSQLISPLPASDTDLLRCHKASYLQKLNDCTLSPAEIRRTGFPLSRALVQREKIIVQGTINVALHALLDGVAFNIAGGTHHAFSDRGEGFCLLNDAAVAAGVLLNKKLVNRILILDLDVHQGNGTAEIFKNRKDVFTLSMHGKKNYPLHKEQSHLDIELDDETNDEMYLQLLQQNLFEVISNFKPQFIFFQAGVDILTEDRLGRLSVSTEACRMRDKIVFETAKQKNIPVAVTMGGGYAPDINTIVNAHANTYRVAADVFL